MKDYTIRVGSKIVGKVKGDEFVKKVSASKHFLHTPPAIAFDLESLSQAEAVGAVRVRVVDRETNTTYKADIDYIRQAGFKLNRGFGPQLALPLSGWICIRRGDFEQPRLF